MTRHPGLALQRNTYIVRIVVPADVRRIIGKRELIQSLQTGDYREAVKKWGPVYKAFKHQIDEARTKGSVSEVDLQPARIALANWSNRERDKSIMITDADPAETPWSIAKRIEDYENATIRSDGWEAIPGFDEKVAEMLTVGGMPTRLGDPIIRQMRGHAAMHLMYAERNAERRRLVLARERLAEAARGANLDEIGVMPQRPSRPLPAPSVTLQKLHDEWVGSITISEKERGRLDHQIRRLIEFVGDIPANHLSKDQIRDFMAIVARIPRRRTASLPDRLAWRPARSTGRCQVGEGQWARCALELRLLRHRNHGDAQRVRPNSSIRRHSDG